MTTPTEPGWYWLRKELGYGIPRKWGVIEVYYDAFSRLTIDDDLPVNYYPECWWGPNIPEPPTD